MSDVLQFTAGFAGRATIPLRQAIEYAQTGPFGTQLTADEYIAGGVPVINPTHIQRGHIAPDDSTTVTPEKAEDLARYRLAVGDIVLGRKGEVDKSALVNQQSKGYVCGSDAMALRPRLGTVPDYLWWFLQSSEAHSQLEFWSVGTTVSGLNQNTIRKVRLPLPDVEEQQRIAHYLDRETARIDTFIGEQQRLIEMLLERRSVVITQATTRGIDGAPLVDSGNVYLEKIPAHWTVSRFSREMDVNGGQVDPRDDPWVDMILVAPNHIEPGTGRIIGRETAREQGADSGKYLANAGQILYSKIRPALNKVAVAAEDCLTSADMYAMSSRRGDDHRYLMYFMLARPFHAFATLASLRVKMPKVNRDELGEAPFLRPPAEEQRKIAAYLDEQTAKIDTLIVETGRFIELARERRAALITAAMTGQVDVREVA